MAASFPVANLANLLSLPARHFAVVDAGQQRARILVAMVTRGRPRLVRAEVVDSHEEGFTTPEELREEVRQRLRQEAPEAVVLVLPQAKILRHVLDVPMTDAGQIRALVEREASNIGGLSESPWVFDAVRLRPFGGPAHPLAAVFCRKADLEELLEGFVEDEQLVFDVRSASDALAAAFAATAPTVRDAVLIDLGARSTGVTVQAGGQTVFASAFPFGSASFTEALAADRGGSLEAAEVLKRTEPPALAPLASPKFHASINAWLAEIERTLREWQGEHPGIQNIGAWPAYLAGGGALQPDLAERLSSLGSRRFHGWPVGGETNPGQSDLAIAWGALLLALGLEGPAPSLLPPARRAMWGRQRLWRALMAANLVLAAMLAVIMMAATSLQVRRLAEKATWKERATDALQHAQDIRFAADAFNARMDAFRPILERQRETIETLQLLQVLQRQHTNANHWYVLLADAASYASGSNKFASRPAPRTFEGRPSTAPNPPSADALTASKSFVAEICLVPQGEQMRQTLSDLVGELKGHPLFRNVDVLPPERRRELVATNLIFPGRHFALELSLAEGDLLPPIPLPRLPATNREPRNTFRTPLARETSSSGNSNRGAFSR